jgi:hypothetical protein
MLRARAEWVGNKHVDIKVMHKAIVKEIGVGSTCEGVPVGGWRRPSRPYR